jgi:hypothetical protein
MRKAQAPSPQDGNNLWTGVYSPETEGTLGAADRGPRRGGRREAALRGLERGAGLSSRRIPETTKQGVGAERIGVMASHLHRLSGVDAMAGVLCGESRSGPDPRELHRRDLREDGHAAGRAVRRGLNPDGHIAATGFKGDPGCARGLNRSQRALGRGSAPPLTGRRVEAVLALLLSISRWRAGARQSAPEAGSRPPPGRTGQVRRGGVRRVAITIPQGRTHRDLRGAGGSSRANAEVRGSPSSGALLDHPLAGWKPSLPAKAGEAVIRGPVDPRSARSCLSVADVG